MPSANTLILRLQGSLQLEGVVREGLAYVARDAHAYADEISEHSALEVRNGVACVSFHCVGGVISLCGGGVITLCVWVIYFLGIHFVFLLVLTNATCREQLVATQITSDEFNSVTYLGCKYTRTGQRSTLNRVSCTCGRPSDLWMCVTTLTTSFARRYHSSHTIDARFFCLHAYSRTEATRALPNARASAYLSPLVSALHVQFMRMQLLLLALPQFAEKRSDEGHRTLFDQEFLSMAAFSTTHRILRPHFRGLPPYHHMYYVTQSIFNIVLLLPIAG